MPDRRPSIILRLTAETMTAINRIDNLLSQPLNVIAEELELQGLGEILSREIRPEALIQSVSWQGILNREAKARESDLPPLRSLTSYWRLWVEAGLVDTGSLVDELNALEAVDRAYLEMDVTLPSPPSYDPFEPFQNYLDEAPHGIGARWAWTQAGGDGSGVRVWDLESGWIIDHEDLVGIPDIGPPVHGQNDTAWSERNHGTAVVGIVAARKNSVGMTGIAHGASVKLTSHFKNGSYLHVADAIQAIVEEASPGDVLLLEVQRALADGTTLPTESDDADFDSIRLAGALGLVVIEAAGNSSPARDLDPDIPTEPDSGATLVGGSNRAVVAAGSLEGHERWLDSNFGSRVNCYAWAEFVASPGFGEQYRWDDGLGDQTSWPQATGSSPGDLDDYTGRFGGTSAASAIVAGAAAVIQGVRKHPPGQTPLNTLAMRSVLEDDSTGTPQINGTGQNIGVMPNLEKILIDLGMAPDVYIRDNVGDDGQVPSAGSISASPDVFVRPALEPNPSAAFGAGGPSEDSISLGSSVITGQDHYVYVRLKNRGTLAADQVTANVYWSEPSTLLDPNDWVNNLIGTTDPMTVPPGDTLTVAGPILWPAGQLPGAGHYCFIAIANAKGDPFLTDLTAFVSFDTFRSFIRNNNNVTWRNFNVVDVPATPQVDGEVGRDDLHLPFLINGAPDRDELFDLEVLRHLAERIDLSLDVPAELAENLERGDQLVRTWRSSTQGRVELHLASHPRLRFKRVRLAKGARHRSFFRVQPQEGAQSWGRGVAIRQLYRGQEIGRVSWRLNARRDQGLAGPP